ncbi:MAG: class II fructose-bisphosphate aldolase [Leucobacter sp.]
MHHMLKDARQNNYAVACINTPTFDMLHAIVGAAEDVGVPLIIDHAEVHDPVVRLESIAPHMVEVARQASVPVALHVDHGVSREFVLRGVRAGFTSVMHDLSKLSFEENVRGLKEVTDFAHAAGITVEAELGLMGSTLGDTHQGDLLENIRDGFTDPEEARRFVEETGVDALAVCFGTIHGIYTEEPNLDLDHLQALRAAVPETTALVMHGSSGVPADQLIAAVQAGVTKVNYYSYLAAEAAQFAATLIAEGGGGVMWHDVSVATHANLRENTREILTLLANGAAPVPAERLSGMRD